MKISVRDVNQAGDIGEIFDATTCFNIRFGEGNGAIVIHVDKGWVRIRSPHEALIIRPGASNDIRVRAAHQGEDA